jgi:uracil-DNA glycosylase
MNYSGQVYFYISSCYKYLIMDVKIEQEWKSMLSEEFEKEYFIRLSEFVRNEYKTKVIYPPGSLIFNAFNKCPFGMVKAVIIGQDPYHGPGQAHGLCFSVKEGVGFPPSLINIFKEIELDLGIKRPQNGNLERWASQGVLLINATLTVMANQAGSHQRKGWEEFTDSVIRVLNREKSNLVFFLWGAYAQKKGESIDRSKHLVLESVHPSPLSASRGFFGNKHFSRCNDYLQEHGKEPVNWE